MRTRKRDEYRAFNGATGAKQRRIPPIAEHHDGFSMWNTKYSEWNAAKMGPKRDLVDELSKSIKHQDMKFVTAFHHTENGFFFPTTDKRLDSSDPRHSGLYGFIHEPYALPTKEHLDRWQGKIIEVIDNYGSRQFCLPSARMPPCSQTRSGECLERCR
jgi:alpha-L-fucosidase